MLEGEVAAGVAAQAGDGGDALVGDVPARAQVERAQTFQAPGDEQQARVGDVAAAAQVQVLQVAQVLRDPAQRRVRDLLAQRQVQPRQRRHVARQRVRDPDVRHVVAAAQVQRLDLRQTCPSVRPTATPIRQYASIICFFLRAHSSSTRTLDVAFRRPFSFLFIT